MYLVRADFTMICLQPSGDRHKTTPIWAWYHSLGALLLVFGSDVMMSARFAAVRAGVVTKGTHPLQVGLKISPRYNHGTSEFNIGRHKKLRDFSL